LDFPIILDSQSETPLHRQLYDEIRRSILSGRLAPGKRVPSTRALAEALGISRATVTMTYDYLLSEGYLQSAVGSGTFVCRQLPDELLRVAKTTNKPSGQHRPPRLATKKLSKYGMSLKDGAWLGFPGDEPEIQFSFGRPAFDHFPMREWMQLMNQHCKKRELGHLDSPSQAKGYKPLREAIAAYLGRARAVKCDPEQIIIVNGSQQAIDLVTRVIVDRGDGVGIEEPGYVGAKKALEMQGGNLVPIPVDGNGLVVELLKDVNHLKLVYVTPSHQFPTGVVLSLPRRLELLSWAQRTGTYIVEDDYDSEYRYTGRPIPSLAGLDQLQNVLYIGTFSKVLYPAMRLGYLVVPERLVEVFTRAKWLTDRHSSLVQQQVLADFINAGHLDRHVRRMRALYQDRRKLVIDELRKTFGDRITIFGDNAGINVLIRLHGAPPSEHIVHRARELGLGITPTHHFYNGTAPDGEFLLNYGGLDEDEIREGIRRLTLAARHS
jgi:GntR family transcriptional regulator / MocR family aminotransferase